MRKILFFGIAAVVLFACKKESSVRIPLNEYSKTWVPANEDSIIYTSLGDDTLYLTFNGYSSFFQLQPEESSLEKVSQQGFTSDSNFFINYSLQAGWPSTDSLGKAFKIDTLRINSLNTQSTIAIGNTNITTNLFFIDTLYLPDSTRFLNVLTDGTDYFMTLENDIIQLKSDTTWYYKE